jgi:uncharacterized protein (UPF0333 family)
MNKVVQKLAWLALGSAFTFMALTAFWLSASFSPAISGTAMFVEESTVHPGGTITVTSDICKLKAVQATLIRSFEDEIVYNLPQLDSNQPVGCNGNRFTIEIPRNLPPDSYTYNVEFVYEINPLVTQSYRYESNEFQVVE